MRYISTYSFFIALKPLKFNGNLLVVVASPNASHFSTAKEAIISEKHVIVEKPFTVTSKEADNLIALSKKYGRTLSAYHNRRWDSDFKTVKRVIESKLLGPAYCMIWALILWIRL